MITIGHSSKNSRVTTKYKNKLNSETLEKCDNYSKFYFQNSHGFQTKEQVEQLKITMKKEAERIAALEENNKDNLANYLEELVLEQDNREFLLPYHLLKQNNIENEDILNYEAHHQLGILGNINDLLRE